MTKLKPNQFFLDGNLITERPILFQTDMVKAILEERKRQTRRTKGLDKYPNYNWCNIHRVNGHNIKCALADEPNQYVLIRPSYGQPGDILWVRETWQTWALGWIFKSTYGPDLPKGITWKPSIHMPKEAAQIWLMIEDIRVERLQDISEEDSIAEGIEFLNNLEGQKSWKRYDNIDLYKRTDQPFVSFWSLWESINGEESWNSNPWVWVIKFRVLSKSGRPSEQVILENYLQITNESHV